VKELLKSVHICQSYRKNKSGTFFMVHGVVSCNWYSLVQRFSKAWILHKTIITNVLYGSGTERSCNLPQIRLHQL